VFSARRLLLAVLLVAAAVIWAKINKPIEGETLLVLSRNHGITTADMLSVVLLAMAVVVAWPSRRPARPSRPAPPISPPTGPPAGPPDGYGTTAPTAYRPAAPGRPPGTTAGPSRR
jgi:hypothetical protein